MKSKQVIRTVAVLTMLLSGLSCATIPRNAAAVKNFEVSRYTGTWYEIARFDYRFEKNLNNVSARYSLNKNGTIKVFNSGYNTEKRKWVSSTGTAKFREDKNTAALKVTFFKPFYAGYNVIAIDDAYKYALVAGGNLDYLWILSRDKKIPDNIKARYLKIARDIGYDTSKLIWIEHNADNPLLIK